MNTRSHRKKPLDPNVAAFNNYHAAEYLGFSPVSLKMSRNTGVLGGRPAPNFKRAGRKVIYLRVVLDSWLEELPTYRNSAQVVGGSRN